MARDVDEFRERWREQQRRDEMYELKAQVATLTEQLRKRRQGGRPGPDWGAYTEFVQAVMQQGVDVDALYSALVRLIVRNEGVQRETAMEQARQIIAGIHDKP